MAKELVVVLDFGGQYNQLIARRIRDLGVYAEVHPSSMGLDQLKALNPKGIIFTGGPQSVYKEESQHIDPAIFSMGIPILGICYGAQLIAYELGGVVKTAPVSEYGHTKVLVDRQDSVLQGISDETTMWMSHTDYIAEVPEGFHIIAHTADCPVAGMEDPARQIYAVQFHPEVQHSVEGHKLFHNFLYEVCKCAGDWKMETFVQDKIAEIRETVKDGKVLLALSGGVDSSVAATLMAKAIGKQLTCVFVDHGLLRKNEGDEVESIFGPNGQYDLNFIRVNAGPEYFEKLAGVTEPEQKRKIIGEQFIRVFEREAKKIGAVDFLCQGTIYPDVVESGLGKGAVIKSHHNVGGLPEDIAFKGLIEPLRILFKDEVRLLGESLNMPAPLVWRQPFPGPGLAIRILGDITDEKLDILRRSDFILRDEIAKAGLDRSIWQYFTVFTGIRSVGVMGDQRTYDYAIGVRAVTSTDAMTVEFAELPYDLLRTISNRIIAETPHVNRVMFDITDKPPGTIEWE